MAKKENESNFRLISNDEVSFSHLDKLLVSNLVSGHV